VDATFRLSQAYVRTCKLPKRRPHAFGSHTVKFAMATPKKNQGNEHVIVEIPSVSGKNSVLCVAIAALIPAQGPKYMITLIRRQRSPATVAMPLVLVTRAYTQKVVVANIGSP